MDSAGNLAQISFSSNYNLLLTAVAFLEGRVTKE